MLKLLSSWFESHNWHWIKTHFDFRQIIRQYVWMKKKTQNRNRLLISVVFFVLVRRHSLSVLHFIIIKIPYEFVFFAYCVTVKRSDEIKWTSTDNCVFSLIWNMDYMPLIKSTWLGTTWNLWQLITVNTYTNPNVFLKFINILQFVVPLNWREKNKLWWIFSCWVFAVGSCCFSQVQTLLNRN